MASTGKKMGLTPMGPLMLSVPRSSLMPTTPVVRTNRVGTAVMTGGWDYTMKLVRSDGMPTALTIRPWHLTTGHKYLVWHMSVCGNELGTKSMPWTERFRQVRRAGYMEGRVLVTQHNYDSRGSLWMTMKQGDARFSKFRKAKTKQEWDMLLGEVRYKVRENLL